MQVAVVGGSDALGASLISALAARGDDVRVLGGAPGAVLPDGTAHVRVDLRTGEGLSGALADVEAVVDAGDSPRDGGRAARRLVEAEAAEGVSHHLGLSAIGCDRMPTRFYRGKLAGEAAVAGGDVPWSLLRTTQTHQALARTFERAASVGVLPTGSARLQPLLPGIVANRVAEAIEAGPSGRLPELAGPRVETLTELALSWRRARERHSLPLRIPMLGPVGRPLRQGALCNAGAAGGGPSFADWLGIL